MKATQAKLLDFLGKPNQFTIPIYQRTYSWEKEHCEQLWDDILRTGKDDNIPSYFIGSIVYIGRDLYQVSNQSPLFVIDGQQRLTTVSLLIEALARYISDQNMRYVSDQNMKEVMDEFSVEELRNSYLLNPYKEGEKRYKLLLTQTDKDSLLGLIDGKPSSTLSSLNIKKNFEFFAKKIKKFSLDVKFLCRGLQKLIIVDISLNRDHDNPQLIFESMNSKGIRLSQADLIRNFILMGLEKEHQDDLYETHWQPMEVAFGQKAYSKYFDSFIRDYLTLTDKTNEIPNIKNVYESFKGYVRRSKEDVNSLVSDIHTFADYYCAIALDKEPNKILKDAFSDLREVKVNVSYPFLLQVYDDYKNDLLSVEEFEYIIRLIESYAFRRAICEMPTYSHNKTFATFSRAIKKDVYVESVKAHFLLLLPSRRFPSNEEFEREIQVRDLYNFRNRHYWLRKLENYERKERVDVSRYTIEHILPQNKNLSPEWQQALGQDWKEIQGEYQHTLGNLTLTGYNSEYGDKFFTEKRDMEGGFRESPLRVNESLRNLETWNENEIKARARNLAKKAITVWPRPYLSPDVLNQYY